MQKCGASSSADIYPAILYASVISTALSELLDFVVY